MFDAVAVNPAPLGNLIFPELKSCRPVVYVLAALLRTRFAVSLRLVEAMEFWTAVGRVEVIEGIPVAPVASTALLAVARPVIVLAAFDQST